MLSDGLRRSRRDLLGEVGIAVALTSAPPNWTESTTAPPSPPVRTRPSPGRAAPRTGAGGARASAPSAASGRGGSPCGSWRPSARSARARDRTAPPSRSRAARLSPCVARVVHQVPHPRSNALVAHRGEPPTQRVVEARRLAPIVETADRDVAAGNVAAPTSAVVQAPPASGARLGARLDHAPLASHHGRVPDLEGASGNPRDQDRPRRAVVTLVRGTYQCAGSARLAGSARASA